MNIHGPSLGICAGIATVSIVAAFFALNFVNTSNEIIIEETNSQPKQIGLSVFTANSSPYLGDKNAPITLVEFGDYQCFFCNRFFHETEDLILTNYVEAGKV